MRIGLFFKYDLEVGKWSENREIPDLWGRVDRYAQTDPVIQVNRSMHHIVKDGTGKST